MGIPGILKEIGKGERIALSKLAVDHLKQHRRPLRIAIDAAIWSFQNQASQGGPNPALRVFYYRLIRLLGLPIHPLFVYDGPNKPKVKRNKRVGVWYSKEERLSKELLQLFHFPYLTAPGEAEAECANLQSRGIVDAVMSQDADTIMFGSSVTLKNWSGEGSRGNHAPTHVDVHRSDEILQNKGLDARGMILVALLSGGDYDTNGVKGFGPQIASDIAKVKTPNFAAQLLRIKSKGDVKALNEWRERLNHELKTNESKLFSRKNNIAIPENFPDDIILGYYTQPAVSSREKLKGIERTINAEWAKEVEFPNKIAELREFTREHFEWAYKSGGRKFMRNLAPSLLAQQLRLRRSMNGVVGVNSIIEKGERFEHDGMAMIRLQIVPSAIVPLDLSREEDRPTDATAPDEDDAADLADGAEAIGEGEVISSQADIPATPSRKRKARFWDPDAAEKHWLPEAILEFGIPGLVKQWDVKQDELRKDPVKWATRKAKPKVKDVSMKAGAMDAYFKASKPGIQKAPAKPFVGILAEVGSARSDRPQPVRSRQTTRKAVPASPQKTRSIAQFFQPSEQPFASSLETVRAYSTSNTTSFPLAGILSNACDDTLPDPGSPTPRRHRNANLSMLPNREYEPSTSIVLSSSPTEAKLSFPTSLSIGLKRDAGTPPPQDPVPDTISLLSSPESLPSPSQLLSSQTDFESMSPVAASKIQERRLYRAQAGRFSSRAGRSVSPSDTIKAAFKTAKPNSGIWKKKVSVVARDSLPGAWKEIDFDNIDDEDLIAAAEAASAPKNKRKAQRVSLVDLT